MKKNILITGVPASGKTTMGNWLAKNYGYTHLDFDEEKHSNLIYKDDGGFDAIKRIIRESPQPFVISFGFVPVYLVWIVKMMMMKEVEAAFWFDADYEIAQELFEKRNKDLPVFVKERKLEQFHIQMARIKRHWEIMYPFFSPNIITTASYIKAGIGHGYEYIPVCVDMDSLWEEMVERMSK